MEAYHVLQGRAECTLPPDAVLTAHACCWAQNTLQHLSRLSRCATVPAEQAGAEASGRALQTEESEAMTAAFISALPRVSCAEAHAPAAADWELPAHEAEPRSECLGAGCSPSFCIITHTLLPSAFMLCARSRQMAHPVAGAFTAPSRRVSL